MYKKVKKEPKVENPSACRKSVREKKEVTLSIVSKVLTKTKLKRKSHKCNICEKKCIREYEIVNGKRLLKKTSKVFTCPRCINVHKRRRKQAKKMRARRRKLARKIPEMICDICGKIEKVKFNLSVHMQKHQNLKCDICSVRHANHFSLIRHLMSYFSSHCCQYCGITIKHIATFEKHIRNHENRQSAKKDPKIFECEHCGMKFATKPSLTYHLERQHKDGAAGTYKCKTCSKVFADRKLYRSHLIEHHEGKLYYCEFEGCEQFFYKSKNLRTHTQIHAEEPKFKCADCGNKYIQQGALYNHRKRINGCKAKIPQVSTEEQQRLEKIARAQIEVLRGKYSLRTSLESKLPKLKKPVEVKEDSGDDFEAASDTSEINDEVIEVEDLAADLNVPGEFANVYIKEEPVDEFEIKEEVVDPDEETKAVLCVVKAEPVGCVVEITETSPKAEFASLQPVVVLERLDPAVLLLWKPVKKEEKSAQPKSKAKQILEAPEGRYGPNSAQGTQVKKSGKRLPCKAFYCTFSTDFADILEKHRKKRHVEMIVRLKTQGPYICDLCNKSFKLKHSLEIHLTKIHHPATIHCHLCIRTFKLQADFQRHLYVSHDDENFRYCCDICGQKAKYMASLKRHMLQSHTKKIDKPKWECPKCHKVVLNCSRAQHKKRCGKKIRAPRHACHICGKMVATLIPHIKNVHTVEFNGKAFDCKQCDETFNRLKDLKAHEMTTHFKGKVHKCEICGKMYPQGKLLNSHKKSHLPNEELFGCDLCPGLKFSYKASVYKHRRRKHPIEFQRDSVAAKAKLEAQALAKRQT